MINRLPYIEKNQTKKVQKSKEKLQTQTHSELDPNAEILTTFFYLNGREILRIDLTYLSGKLKTNPDPWVQ